MIILEVHRPIWPQPSVSAHIQTPEVLLNSQMFPETHTVFRAFVKVQIFRKLAGGLVSIFTRWV